MAVDYLRDYLGIDPADYSAMERTIAGVSPVGQSIIPTMGATPTVQPRMIDDTPIAFTPRPMQDFGAQISGLEEQINNLMEQMGVLEAEKNDALQQQDVMRAELAQAQQDALTEQASEFEGVKSSLEKQIADLTAQIGSMQEPTIMKDAPVPPRDEQIFVPPKDFVDPRASRPRGEPIGGMVPGGGGIDYGGGEGPPLLSDLTPTEPFVPPQQPPRVPLSERTDIYGAGKRYDPANLPEGFSFVDTSGMIRPTVMPPAGFVYAYGPDGEQIKVPSGEPGAAEMRERGAARDKAFRDFQKTNPGEPYFGGLKPPPTLNAGIIPPPSRGRQVPPEDFGFGPGIRPSEITTGGQFDGSAGVTPRPIRGGGTYKEFEGPNGSVLSVGVQDPLLELVKKRDPILPPEGITPRPPSIPPMTPPMTPPMPMPMPRPMPEPVIPSMPMPQPMIPIEPQPMPMAGRQMNMMFDNMPPTMMRAGGGGISKAIVDLKNRLR